MGSHPATTSICSNEVFDCGVTPDSLNQSSKVYVCIGCRKGWHYPCLSTNGIEVEVDPFGGKWHTPKACRGPYSCCRYDNRCNDCLGRKTESFKIEEHLVAEKTIPLGWQCLLCLSKAFPNTKCFTLPVIECKVEVSMLEGNSRSQKRSPQTVLAACRTIKELDPSPSESCIDVKPCPSKSCVDVNPSSTKHLVGQNLSLEAIYSEIEYIARTRLQILGKLEKNFLTNLQGDELKSAGYSMSQNAKLEVQRKLEIQEVVAVRNRGDSPTIALEDQEHHILEPGDTLPYGLPSEGLEKLGMQAAVEHKPSTIPMKWGQRRERSPGDLTSLSAVCHKTSNHCSKRNREDEDSHSPNTTYRKKLHVETLSTRATEDFKKAVKQEVGSYDSLSQTIIPEMTLNQLHLTETCQNPVPTLEMSTPQSMMIEQSRVDCVDNLTITQKVKVEQLQRNETLADTVSTLEISTPQITEMNEQNGADGVDSLAIIQKVKIEQLQHTETLKNPVSAVEISTPQNNEMIEQNRANGMDSLTVTQKVKVEQLQPIETCTYPVPTPEMSTRQSMMIEQNQANGVDSLTITQKVKVEQLQPIETLTNPVSTLEISTPQSMEMSEQNGSNGEDSLKITQMGKAEVSRCQFGLIFAEHDCRRYQRVLAGDIFKSRRNCMESGVHLSRISGIAGQARNGAQSVCLSEGYEDDEDHGDWFLYTGSGGRVAANSKKCIDSKDEETDQDFTRHNMSLRVSCINGLPVRVVRKINCSTSLFATDTRTSCKSYRYDGIYRVEKCWRTEGKKGSKICRFLFVRCDNEPAPWRNQRQVEEETGMPSPLEYVALMIAQAEMKIGQELQQSLETVEITASPFWNWKVTEKEWGWVKDPPVIRHAGGKKKVNL